MPINLAAIKDELLPGLYELTGKYPQIKTQWTEVFEKATSTMALERSVQMRFLPLARIKTEGGQTHFDQAAGQRYVYNQEHNEVGLGYAVTRKAIDDNLYRSQFNLTQLNLQDVFAQTKEIFAADILNSATTANANIGGDGKALCATDHPLDLGTFANRPTVDIGLNEAGLEAAETSIRGFKDQAGLKVLAKSRKLVVPRALKFVAERLTKTTLRVGTANNDVNALMSSSTLPEGYTVMDFLTSAYAWYVLTDKKGLRYMQRKPFETDMQVDFTTDNLLVKGYERYSFAHYDPRVIYGSFPTA